MNFSFDDLVLDMERRELTRSGMIIAVEPQVFDLLVFLLTHRDRVVTKDELVDAVWDGRIVSDSALTSRINSARVAIGDTGKDQRLIKTLRRKGLRFVGDVREHRPTVPIRPTHLSIPDRPSIAVLPFANVSTEAGTEYFADGLLEELTMALGRLPWLFVIASGSTLTYKTRNVEARQVGSELGVRYVLQGSVRKDGSRIRISVQLTDTSNGRQMWSERLDGNLEKIFEFQDEIVTQLSARVAPALRSLEIERARSKSTTNLTAYDLYLRALPPRRDNRSQNEESLRLLYRAVELDPSFSSAYGLAAWCYEIQAVFGWISLQQPEWSEGLRLANLAIEHGDRDAEAHWMAGLSFATLAGDLERARSLIDKSLSLNPNSSRALWACGIVLSYLGETAVAIDKFAQSRRLNPLDTAPYAYWAAICMVHFLADDMDSARDAADKALSDWPDAPAALRLKAAISGLSGNIAIGRTCVDRLLAVQPTTSITSIVSLYQLKWANNPRALQNVVEGLRRCGLIEQPSSLKGVTRKY